VRSRPLLTLDSGPVSGVLGARYFGEVYGEPNIICADMGGTTFDVALIEQGRYIFDEEPVIDRYTCLIPKVAVESIGAGGGSIVWIDENDLMRVGPQSAGAEPGPACYGQGGTEPTVTDVNIVLGYVSPDGFLGGEMKLDRASAERALDRAAVRLGIGRMETAAGAFRIVNAHMADLMRRTSIDRGRDPRDFVLFAYGGAGAIHIAYLARELGISKIYVPSFATVFSALGMLTGGILHSAERSFSASFPVAAATWGELGAVFTQLERKLDDLLDQEQIDRSARRYQRYVQMKFRLQPRALPVMVSGDLDRPDAQEQLIAGFEREYSGLYGANASYRDAGVEIVKCRVEGSAPTVLPKLVPQDIESESDASGALRAQRDIYLTELNGFVRAPIYEGERLKPGMRIAGPAVVERMGDTILLPTFASATVDGFGNIVLKLASR
jgi:N-methylhydantoinase A